MIESLNEQFWHAVMFFLAAVVSAALLRHAVHVYCGVSPEQIGTCALIPFFLLVFSLASRSAVARSEFSG